MEIATLKPPAKAVHSRSERDRLSSRSATFPQRTSNCRRCSHRQYVLPEWKRHHPHQSRLGQPRQRRNPCNSVRGRQKDRNLRHRRHASLLFVDPDNSYHWMSIQGVVDDVIDEDDPVRGSMATDFINQLSQMYLDESSYLSAIRRHRSPFPVPYSRSRLE